MATNSSIEWTEVTWNPVTGCSKLSQGCKNCYAARMAKRLHAMGSIRYSNGFEVTLHRDLIDLPRKWKKPRTVFVNSMSDLFHDEVPDDFISLVFKTMAECPQHTFQVLTKRSSRLKRMGTALNWAPNIWMGVSVESEQVKFRIEDLKKVNARVRFLSCEPLLEPLSDLDLNGVHWVIVGGESGPGARLMPYEWAESLRLQCEHAGVAFFFKQWGGVQKQRYGRMLNGTLFDQKPVLTSNWDSLVEITLK